MKGVWDLFVKFDEFMLWVIWVILKFVEGDLFLFLGLFWLVVIFVFGGFLFLIFVCDFGFELMMLLIVKGEVCFLFVGGVVLCVGVCWIEFVCFVEDNILFGNEFIKMFIMEGVLGDLVMVLLGVVGEVLMGFFLLIFEVFGVEEINVCEEGVFWDCIVEVVIIGGGCLGRVLFSRL